MKKILIFSVALNILLLLLCAYLLYKNEALDFMDGQEKPGRVKFGVYYEDRKHFFESLPNDTSEIIFLGNSIIAGCDWAELFRNPKIKNRGIGGDKLMGVINRIDEVVESYPQKIFLLIGTNDLARGKPGDRILSEYEQLITLIKTKSPRTGLYIHSILPTKDRKAQKNDAILEINKGLMELSAKYNLVFINLFDSFKDANNDLSETYSYDGLHLNGDGYFLWKNRIEEYVNN